MANCQFSVAMSVYKNDNPAFFDRALQSITVLQTVKPSEIVLVVDGPVDKSFDDVIEKYQSLYPIFNVIRLDRNGGLGNALKLAVENANSDLIARMDSDDVSLPTRFEQQLSFFEKESSVDIVGGDISEFIGEEENIVAYRKVPTQDSEIRSYMRKRCPFNHVSVMFRKSAVLGAGGYIDLFWNEDYYLWIRMSQNGSIMANTGTVLVNVRTGADMYARRGGKQYFQSEKYLQNYMLRHKMIGYPTYISNITKRWIVQRCLPNWLRGWVFRNFARNSK